MKAATRPTISMRSRESRSLGQRGIAAGADRERTEARLPVAPRISKDRPSFVPTRGEGRSRLPLLWRVLWRALRPHLSGPAPAPPCPMANRAFVSKTIDCLRQSSRQPCDKRGGECTSSIAIRYQLTHSTQLDHRRSRHRPLRKKPDIQNPTHGPSPQCETASHRSARPRNHRPDDRDQAKLTVVRAARRRIEAPTRPKPMIISAQVAGSGTAAFGWK